VRVCMFQTGLTTTARGWGTAWESATTDIFICF